MLVLGRWQVSSWLEVESAQKARRQKSAFPLVVYLLDQVPFVAEGLLFFFVAVWLIENVRPCYGDILSIELHHLAEKHFEHILLYFDQLMNVFSCHVYVFSILLGQIVIDVHSCSAAKQFADLSVDLFYLHRFCKVYGIPPLNLVR